MDRAFLVYRDLTRFEFEVNGVAIIQPSYRLTAGK
jgi:hypothetical protein